MESLSFTKATELDIPQIRVLAERIWRACYVRMIGEAQVAYMLDWMYGEAEIRRQLSVGIDWRLVKLMKDLVGYLALTWDPGNCELELNKLYLDTSLHGRGLGQQMLEYVKGHPRSLGARVVKLRVNKGNTAAQAAYRRAGFVVAEELCQDIGNGFVMDDYIMVWRDA